ncbi:S-adenosyl-L-methionine-dependent methyltransferase [Bimuria novae-zelandiae CBS 107.79]|uniref:S-adenosyl-L-methionine-dependent methyltransferase n=1 Tax=Bimuria novae-zelandiae CBS 107.79 TaxID=1447943 RepID=A0A6A5VG19_9PLEO|nr:S-adenosyl-L-methionine-dependent methyltransferase [Bimuria novae-zelandiae CBS 107.79]
MATQPKKSDWSATQYLKFSTERTRAVYDLLSRTAPHIQTPSPRIYDLGCGPGNSTSVLLSAFPSARITGMDSSPDMLAKASSSGLPTPQVDFIQGDLATFKPGEGEEEGADMLFSNAVFHWLRGNTRLQTLVRLFKGLRKGGVLAIQVPDNYHAASHALMRATACMPDTPWSPAFAHTRIGDVSDPSRPDLDPIEAPAAFYDALAEHAQSVDVWRTEYFHVLASPRAIVEWVKGTGLQPYLHAIGDERARKAFLEEYERKLAEAYPGLVDGKVLLGYPRLFVVAVRK